MGGLSSIAVLRPMKPEHAPLDGAAHRAAIDHLDAGALGDLGADLGEGQRLVDVVLVDVAEPHVLGRPWCAARVARSSTGAMALPNSTQRVSTRLDLVVGDLAC